MSEHDDLILGDLDEALAIDEGADPEPPEDADQASEMLRKMARIASQRTELERRFRPTISRLEEELASRLRPLDGKLQWYKAGLEGWHRAVHRPGQPKTQHFPFGHSKLTKTQPTVEVVDEEAFKTWALGYAPEMLNMSPKNTEIRKACSKMISQIQDQKISAQAVTDDGEKIPGVVLHPKPDSHSYTTETPDER